MKIRYTETALVEINEIFAYIFERNPSAAERVVARIERTIQNLGDFPEMAQEADEPGARRMPVAGYPFLVFYTIEADEVVILHVWHGARRPPWQRDEED
jgi:plasmid stabilization system protein ParE